MEKALLLVSAFIVQILKLMKKILLIEDEFYILDLYRIILEKAGFEVLLAEDGEKGYNLAQNLPNLILLDIMLPKITGIDVLRTMRAPTSPSKDTPIILITNLGQEDIIKEAFKIGADGYLIKAQFTPQDVIAEVDAFFEQMEQLRQTAAQQPTGTVSASENIQSVVPPQTTPSQPVPNPTIAAANIPTEQKTETQTSIPQDKVPDTY